MLPSRPHKSTSSTENEKPQTHKKHLHLISDNQICLVAHYNGTWERCAIPQESTWFISALFLVAVLSRDRSPLKTNKRKQIIARPGFTCNVVTLHFWGEVAKRAVLMTDVERTVFLICIELVGITYLCLRYYRVRVSNEADGL